jgi:threonine aldolase
MRAVMAAAPVGDYVFGDDPSINALEAEVAEMLGFEASLFVPSGTQSNLIGVMTHCARGDEYIVGQQAHTYRYEAGGAAVLGSVQPQPLNNAADGTLPLADIEAAIKPDDSHFARTRVIALETRSAAGFAGWLFARRCASWPTSVALRCISTARVCGTPRSSGRWNRVPLRGLRFGFDVTCQGLGAPSDRCCARAVISSGRATLAQNA